MEHRYCFLLSQEHEKMPEDEAKSVLRAEDISFNSKKLEELLMLETDREIPEKVFEKLSLTFEVSKVIGWLERVEKANSSNFEIDKSFAVRYKNLSESENHKNNIESKLGSIIKDKTGKEVDLENPTDLFKVYQLNGKLLFTKILLQINRSQFQERRNQFRPYSSPVTLHPRLARALVNLSGVKAEDSVLDPFCGTGGILIEAGLIGCKALGSDIDSEMIEGCRKNLKHYNISQFSLKLADISDIDKIYQKVDAVVSDLPYGRASEQEGKSKELHRRFVEKSQKLTDNVVFMSNRSEVEGLEPDFKLYVHSGLNRYIYCL